MDINDDFEQQQQPDQQPQQMQCDSDQPISRLVLPNTNIMEEQHQLPTQTAIPLPPPQSLLSKPQHLAPPPTATDIDIDSQLLQQFSCLGTTDHEDLISQFQSLMNNQMNKDSAKFFLEMSNWNLQTAVGCYLDFCNFQTIPSMKIIEQSYPSEFQQAWRIRNDGNEDWPNGCYLMSPSQTQKIEVPALQRGETCDIFIDIPPTQPAIMWRLCTPNGWYFGESICMIPLGTCASPAELTEKMAQLRTSSNHESFPQVNVIISGKNMD